MKAKCGMDYIRDKDWQPINKGLNPWSVWAKREAKKMSNNGFIFNAVICRCEGYLRISFAGQPEKIL